MIKLILGEGLPRLDFAEDLGEPATRHALLIRAHTES